FKPAHVFYTFMFLGAGADAAITPTSVLSLSLIRRDTNSDHTVTMATYYGYNTTLDTNPVTFAIATGAGRCTLCVAFSFGLDPSIALASHTGNTGTGTVASASALSTGGDAFIIITVIDGPIE